MEISQTGIGLSTEQTLKMVAIIALPRSPLIIFWGILLIIPQLFHDRNRLPNKGYQFTLMVMKKPISQEALVDIDRVPNINFGEMWVWVNTSI